MARQSRQPQFARDERIPTARCRRWPFLPARVPSRHELRTGVPASHGKAHHDRAGSSFTTSARARSHPHTQGTQVQSWLLFSGDKQRPQKTFLCSLWRQINNDDTPTPPSVRLPRTMPCYGTFPSTRTRVPSFGQTLRPSLIKLVLVKQRPQRTFRSEMVWKCRAIVG